ncbi:MAG: cytochrome c biogenesis protein ResB [Angustibacter sp.]
MTSKNPPLAGAKLGARGWLRFCWRQLTSMRTALFLLLLLAVAAVPGSIFPQRSVDPTAVVNYLRDHRRAGPWLDRLSAFDVYSSPWFSAIYLLLFISLIGCVLPRLRKHWLALRAQPPRAPSNLHRLPAHRSESMPGSAETLGAEIRQALRSRRYRVAVREDQLSAERGYAKESGNLIFHFSLIIVLVGIAAGHLLGWRGDVVVPVGDSITNIAVNYDEFTSGPWVNREEIPPFSVELTRLEARFAATGPERGAPRFFRAEVLKQLPSGAGLGPGRSDVVEVNRPLKIAGAQLSLLGNGYAPVISVRDSTAKVVYSQATVFPPIDANYQSQGVVRVPGAQPKQLGISAIFLPTIAEGAGRPVSLFPDALKPRLLLTAFDGDLGLGSANPPRSVYQLNTDSMQQLVDDQGRAFTVALAPGQTVKLPGGRGSITFDRVERFAGFNVRYDPGRHWALGGAIFALLGLILSLFIPRRRIFVTLRRESTGDTLVTIAALARGEDHGLAREIDHIFTAIHDAIGKDLTRDQ